MRLIDADKINPRSICPIKEDDSAYDTLCDFIAEQPTVPMWISIKDRLPKEDERVLVFAPVHNKIQVCYYRRYTYGNRNEIYWYAVTTRNSHNHFTWRITHWMPLPEPPQKGE